MVENVRRLSAALYGTPSGHEIQYRNPVLRMLWDIWCLMLPLFYPLSDFIVGVVIIEVTRYKQR